MSEGSVIALDSDLNVGPDRRMRSRAHRSESPTSRAALRSHENDAAFSTAPRSASRPSAPPAPPPFAEPPAETDAWWLSRAADPTFSRRRIALAAGPARAVGPTERLVVEFNGALFEGARVAALAGRYELDLGDALAAEMASVLDDDDGLTVELVTGRAAPTLAIHPYVCDPR